MNRIRADLLTAKLHSIAELEHLDVAEQFQDKPKLAELLWFVQAMSLQPGGLSQFVQHFVTLFESRFHAVETHSVFEERHTHTKEQCISQARSDLARYLTDLCVNKDKKITGVFYCRELVELLFEVMEIHRANTLKQIATTETTRTAFRWLEFAYQSKTPVPIVGASRFGKTTAVKAWCDSRPSLARLVTVPDSNRERDFFGAHADAFGIEYSPATPTARLREDVEYVHRHSGLFVVYDEAQFLLPVTYGKTTAPKRLNWVRCQVIDRRLGCAFFATPQSYKQTLEKFARQTGYTLEQWVGRMAPTVTLPEELDRKDLLAVARLKFPGICEELRGIICARAMKSQGYLKNIELVANYAQFLAKERQASEVGLEDVEAAIREILPGAAGKPLAEPLQRDRKAAAEVVQSPRSGLTGTRNLPDPTFALPG